MRPALRDPRPEALGTHNRRAITPAPTAVRDPWSDLSGAERTIAILAAAGWTSAAIAARRGTSVRTVEAQLAAVLRKLVITSRRRIAEFVPEELVAQVRREARRKAPRRTRHHRARV
ncbi:LuxR C-terminal-related transcriptional regulator [Nocardia sp. NPDC003963]